MSAETSAVSMMKDEQRESSTLAAPLAAVEDATAASSPAPPALKGVGSVEEATQAARMQGALLPGSTFGVYVVGECIGEGGMARIYRAEHAGLRRQVALKVLTNGFAKDSEGRERFVREARIAAAIKHPNVVNIFDVGVYEGIPYLVMELLEGTDLESMVREKGALDESVILDVMVPVVAGLAAVHDAGVVHRDLKPGNIFLAKGRYEEIEPKLLDFGISKANGPDQLKLTTHGLLMGTPFYMSPEGFRGEEMTSLSDQYSLGVVMYECATGRGPFIALTLPELVRVITSGEYRPPHQCNPNISKHMARIIARAMSLDPADRYADLREMGRDLLQLAGQRTRITWGLSFGDASAAAATALRSRSSAPTLAVGAPTASSKPATRSPLWFLAPLVLFAVLALLIGKVQLDEPRSHEVAPGLGLAVKAASPLPLPAAVVAPRASPSSSPTEGTAPEVVPLGAATRAVVKPTAKASRPRLVGARAGARPLASEEAPEWALPAPPGTAVNPQKLPDGRPPSGTNGAPIFD